jgi:hypothetical protein
MPRYLVTTRRSVRQTGDVPSALAATRGEPGVTIVNSANPEMVTIDTTSDVAERLSRKLAGTHFVEPEIRRGLQQDEGEK